MTNKKTEKKKKSHKKKSNQKFMIIVGAVVVALALVLIFNLDKLMPEEKVEGDIVAKINNEEISNEELDTRYELFFFLTGYPEEFRSTVTKEVFLEQLITEKILLQEAKDVKISDDQVNEEVTEVLEKSGISEEEMVVELEKNDFSMNDLKDYYKSQMIIAEFLNGTLFSEISVDESVIENYYEENKDQYEAGENEIRARHILVETEEEANEIYEEVNIENFAEIAKEKSVGPSSVSGGELGFFSEGQMVSEFEDVAFALTVNEISEPVQTQFGWHIIQKQPNKIYLSEIKNELKEALMFEQQKGILDEYVADLKENAEIEIVNKEAKPVVNGDCIGNYDLDSDAVIFYHASWCPHCKNMVPIVNELKEEGYNFHWAESESGEGVDVVVECFQDVLQGGVPQFICAGTKDYKMGEMSKSALKAFADECKS